MSERILLEYQKTIPKSLRIITNISHTGFFKELEELSDDKIANFFNENLLKVPIPNVFSKNHTESDKYSMKMAYDNKQLIKHKISDLQKIHSLQIISMDEKYVYGLYCKNPIQSTIIIYFDTYNIDFEGGEFHFHDQTIYPQRGMLLFFHVDNLHKVAPLTGGKRRAIVVKIF